MKCTGLGSGSTKRRRGHNQFEEGETWMSQGSGNRKIWI